MRQQLISGRMTAGELVPSLRELSRQHGISDKTAQRALRRLESEGLIAAEPRTGYRVLARIHSVESGCPLAVILSSGKPKWDLLQQQIVDRLQAVASRQGIPLLTVGTENASAEDVVRQLLAARAWGTLLNVPDNELRDRLAKAGMPVVKLESPAEDGGIDAVVQDGYGGAMQAAAHLASRGHERIGWVGYELVNANPQITERYAGAVGGLSRFGRELSPDLRVLVPYDDQEAALAGARRLLSRPDRPTAVLALWQPMVRVVVRAAAELGLVPGRDFEMVGWWTEDTREREYDALFPNGPVPPVVTWSIATMAEIAFSRIRERHARPGLPAITLKIPARLGGIEPAAREKTGGSGGV
jgi:LacI family transcriptional regulator